MDKPTLLFIYNVMVEFFGMEFFENVRVRSISDKKKMFCLVARRYGYGWDAIRKFLGWKSHGSAVVAADAMRNLMSVYPIYQKQFNEIVNKVEAEWNTPTVIDNW